MGGIPGSKQETCETPWSKTLWVQKVAMGSRGGWDKHWELLHRNPTSGLRNPKLKVAGSSGTVMRKVSFKHAVRDRDETQIHDLNCVIILT